jgi:hypothetical protein
MNTSGYWLVGMVQSQCALMQVLLPSLQCGITSLCFAHGANDRASVMGGHIAGSV